MGSPAEVNPPPERWEFLLSHHLPAQYARTLPVPGTRGRRRLCARCTGQGLGVAAYAALVLTATLPLAFVLQPPFQLVWVVAPLPAAVDWSLQAIRGRESTNLRRLISGALLGAAFLDVLLLLLTRTWLGVAAAVVVFLAYALGIAALLFASGAWRRVLEEHLPGIVLPPESRPGGGAV